MSAELLQKISKPHLVDLLRHFDHNRWIAPRIRYASVRSKPELIADISEVFQVLCDRSGMLEFRPRRRIVGLPTIHYHLADRVYLINGEERNVPKESRRKPVFSIRKGPVTLTFEEFLPSH